MAHETLLTRRLPLSSCLGAGMVVLCLTALLATASGAVTIAPAGILSQLGDWLFGIGEPLPERDRFILWSLRLPRIALAVLVGASLALAGTALQGLFRNPLADPGLIGVSSGAALAAAAVIVLAGDLLRLSIALPLAAFAGGLLATVCVFLLSRRQGILSVGTMLLAGIAINALAGAGIGLFSYLGNDLQLRQLTFWTLGSLGSASWETVLPAGGLMVIACVALLSQARKLDVFVLGERDAFALGISPTALSIRVIVLCALAVGAAVAVSGLIGFLGLVVPHIVRMVLGPSHQRVMTASMVLGAIVLVVADSLARTIALPAEVPIGLLLSLIGAPFFLWLLRRTPTSGV